MTIKILLAEDHELTRQGIAYGLKKYENIEVVAEAATGFEAVEFVNKYKTDVVLMDIMMPVMNGIKATQIIKAANNDIKIIMLTSYNEKEEVLSAFNSGANAYCLKNIGLDDLINIIKTVMDGAMWMDPSIAGYILEIIQAKSNLEKIQADNEDNFNLTSREKEILKLIAIGKNNKDIADKLFISVYTVKNHVRNIFKKLAVEDRTQAAIIALRDKII